MNNETKSTPFRGSGGRKAATGFIFVTILIDVIGWGIIIPVIPKLIAGLIHSDISAAASKGGLLITAYAIMQFFFSPIIGNLSDAYGRRPVLLASLFAFAVDYMLTGFAPNIGWLFVGRILAGITGASITTAGAYIADVSPPEKRAQNFGMIGVAFGVGFIIGPLIGGLLAGFGPRVPFFVCAGLSILNWIYGYFVLPESLPKENRRKFEWKRANPIGSLKLLKRYPAIGGLVTSFILIYIAAHAIQSTWSYYGMEKFKWAEWQVGVSLAVVGFMVALVQGILIRQTSKIFGNEKSVYVGLTLYSVGMILFAFATQGWMMYAFTVIYCLGGIAGPALQAIISNHVPANEQGELQGALTSLISLTAIFGPMLMTNLFSYFTNIKKHIWFPGAPFVAGAIMMLLSAFFAYRVLYAEKHPQKEAA